MAFVWSVLTLALVSLPLVTLAYPGPLYRGSRGWGAVDVYQHDLRNKRYVPEAMLDPYSVLGFLSFATFLFCILYNKHKLKPAEKPAPTGGQTGGGGAIPPIFLQAFDPQSEDFQSIYKLTTIYLDHHDKLNASAGKADEIEYDESAELMDKKPPARKGSSRMRK